MFVDGLIDGAVLVQLVSVFHRVHVDDVLDNDVAPLVLNETVHFLLNIGYTTLSAQESITTFDCPTCLVLSKFHHENDHHDLFAIGAEDPTKLTELHGSKLSIIFVHEIELHPFPVYANTTLYVPPQSLVTCA